MSGQDICFPVSVGELARRHAAVRDAMAASRLDVLLMQNNNDFHGGYVKWFTDTPAVYGGYLAVLFPLDVGMTLVAHGAPREAEALGDDKGRGIARVVTRPTFAAADYTSNYQAACVADELRDKRYRRVGVVGATSLSAAFLDGVRGGAGSSVEFVDATELVDRIKAVKSDEELDLIRRCAHLQDEAFSAVLEAVRPG